MKYFSRIGGIPNRVPSNRVLAHNQIAHTVDMPHGLFGFRCWLWPKDQVPAAFIDCPCGWAGLPHVAWRDHIEAAEGKAKTWEQIANGHNGDEDIHWVPSDVGIGFDLHGAEAAIGAAATVTVEPVASGQYDKLVPESVKAWRHQFLVQPDREQNKMILPHDQVNG